MQARLGWLPDQTSWQTNQKFDPASFSISVWLPGSLLEGKIEIFLATGCSLAGGCDWSLLFTSDQASLQSVASLLSVVVSSLVCRPNLPGCRSGKQRICTSTRQENLQADQSTGLPTSLPVDKSGVHASPLISRLANH